MKDFKLAEPVSLLQASAFLAQAGERAAAVSGGTDLVGLLKEGIVEPETVVDLKSIPGLAYVKRDAEGWHIGALTTVAETAGDPGIRQYLRGLGEAAAVVGSPQLRHMGTVGGNLCQRPRCWYFRDAQAVCRKKGGNTCFAVLGRNRYHAVLGASVCHIVYPSDLAPALISLGAKVAIASPAGERTIPLEEFYAPPSVDVRKENVLAAGNLIREVIVPAPAPGSKSAYLKFIERGAFDFAVVSAAVAATLSGKKVQDVRLVLGGVAPVPWRVPAAEDLLRGKTLTEAAARAAVSEALRNARPMTENSSKVDIARVIGTRALMSLLTNASG